MLGSQWDLAASRRALLRKIIRPEHVIGQGETPSPQEHRGTQEKTKARAFRLWLSKPTLAIVYSALILARNSELPLVLLSLSISNSMASTGESGFRTLRRTQMRERSSFGISSSSFRVPER